MTQQDTEHDTLDLLDFAIPCDTEDNPQHPAEVYVTFSCGHGDFFCLAHVDALRDTLTFAAMASRLGVDLIACAICEAPAPAIVSIDPLTVTA